MVTFFTAARPAALRISLCRFYFLVVLGPYVSLTALHAIHACRAYLYAVYGVRGRGNATPDDGVPGCSWSSVFYFTHSPKMSIFDRQLTENGKERNHLQTLLELWRYTAQTDLLGT